MISAARTAFARDLLAAQRPKKTRLELRRPRREWREESGRKAASVCANREARSRIVILAHRLILKVARVTHRVLTPLIRRNCKTAGGTPALRERSLERLCHAVAA